MEPPTQSVRSVGGRGTPSMCETSCGLTALREGATETTALRTGPHRPVDRRKLTLCFVCAVTVCTYCCTFLDLLLFFSPKVLSSMIFSACGRVGSGWAVGGQHKRQQRSHAGVEWLSVTSHREGTHAWA